MNCFIGTGSQASAEVKALRQWCESQLKKLSVNEGKIWLFSANTDGVGFVTHLARRLPRSRTQSDAS